MGKQSSLGPIDPHLRGIPAQGVIEEFEQALREYKLDPASLAIWQQIIQQYRPTFLGQCKRAIEWTEEFVTRQLESTMFCGDPDASTKAKSIVEYFSSSGDHKAHERHISPAQCIEIGLRIEMMEDDDRLQDLILTTHHCYIHTLMNSAAFKIIENQLGVALIKNQRTGN